MGTPHNSAAKGDIAKTVLMAGDPLRAKYMADNYLENPRLVNEVRGMYAYTGTYKGTEVTCMGHGMGIPSIGIYSYELFHFYDVDNIIRVGSAGGLQDNVNVMDIVFALAASTDSNFGRQYGFPAGYAAAASFPLLETAIGCARELNIPFHVGNVFSEDAFYRSDDLLKRMADIGVLACEMEASALYINAAEAKKQALTILTISDHVFKEGELSADERQTGFKQTIEIALETAKKIG